MVSTTQTQTQVKSQEIYGHIKQHFMTTSPLTYVTKAIQKCCIKNWMHLDLRPANKLVGGLQPLKTLHLSII